jgi:uncharacterized membrane protein
LGSTAPSAVSEDERLWGFIAWVIPLIGGVLALALKPNYKYAVYWAYLSISFFIVIIGGWVVVFVFSIIPLIGHILSFIMGVIIGIGLLIVWIIGILRSLEINWWRPPLIYDIAKILNPRLEEYIVKPA